MEFLEWMEGNWIQSFETMRLRTCSWRRKGDNSRDRKKGRKTDMFKQTLKVMFYKITSFMSRRVRSCFCLCFLLWAEVGCGNPVLTRHCRTSRDIGTRHRPMPLLQHRWVLTRTNSCVSTPLCWSFTGVMSMFRNSLLCFTYVSWIHTYNPGG